MTFHGTLFNHGLWLWLVLMGRSHYWTFLLELKPPFVDFTGKGPRISPRPPNFVASNLMKRD
jgi:hypothetical protein